MTHSEIRETLQPSTIASKYTQTCWALRSMYRDRMVVHVSAEVLNYLYLYLLSNNNRYVTMLSLLNSVYCNVHVYLIMMWTYNIVFSLLGITWRSIWCNISHRLLYFYMTKFISRPKESTSLCDKCLFAYFTTYTHLLVLEIKILGCTVMYCFMYIVSCWLTSFTISTGHMGGCREAGWWWWVRLYTSTDIWKYRK